MDRGQAGATGGMPFGLGGIFRPQDLGKGLYARYLRRYGSRDWVRSCSPP